MKAVGWSMALVLVLAVPAIAAAQDGQGDGARLKQMMACDGIAKKKARLACYDDLARPRSAAATVAQPAPQAALDPASPQAFGLETVKEDRRDRSRPAKLEQINATATSASDAGVGRWIITLDNGARWQVIESDFRFAPPESGEAVRIRRASMGSYLMDVAHQASVRVQRVQ